MYIQGGRVICGLGVVWVITKKPLHRRKDSPKLPSFKVFALRNLAPLPMRAVAVSSSSPFSPTLSTVLIIIKVVNAFVKRFYGVRGIIGCFVSIYWGVGGVLFGCTL